MKPQKKVFWPAILVLAAPLALALPAEKGRPTYRGKALSTWLEQLRSDNLKDRQEAAVVLEESTGQGRSPCPPSGFPEGQSFRRFQRRTGVGPHRQAGSSRADGSLQGQERVRERTGVAVPWEAWPQGPRSGAWFDRDPEEGGW